MRARGSSRPPAQALLHNSGVPPRTRIVLAPRRRRRLTHLQVPQEFLSKVNDRDAKLHFTCRLLHQFGLGRTRKRDRAEALLEQATARALEEAGIGAAAVCIENDPRRRIAANLEPLLALAIISRCSGGLFLRSRKPRFDYHTVRRVVLFYRDAPPWGTA